MVSLLAFAIGFASAAAQWAFILRVRQLLVERHPETWRGLVSKRWNNDFSAAQGFAWSKDIHEVSDPELAKNAWFLRLTSAVTLSVIAVYGLMIVRLLH